MDAPVVVERAALLAGAESDGAAAKAARAVAHEGGRGPRVVVGDDGRVAFVSPGGPAPFAGVAVERRWAAPLPDVPVGGARVAPARPLEGNAFEPVFDNDHFAVARWSLAAGRAFAAGPESERWFVLVAGEGLAFLPNGDTLRLPPESVLGVPAGEPVRLFSRAGMQGVAIQPQGATAERRTLKGELERLRGK